MGHKRKKKDPRNAYIVFLLLLVAVETFILINPQGAKTISKKIFGDFHKNSNRALIAKEDFSSPKPSASPKLSVSTSSPKKADGDEPVKFNSPQPRIAIILDDWGYRWESCQDIKAINSPLAVAILPGLAHSKKIAQCAHEAHKVVMLHLPLEPHQFTEDYPNNYIITTAMTNNRVEKILTQNLNEIPYLAGVNNHMGSKATEDRRLMSFILTHLKRRGLFFVDSVVTGKSICRPLAKQMDVPFAKRDIFLDNKNERAYIEGQFKQLTDLAKRKGYAVAIGHDRPLTLKILKEQVEKLKNDGFRIVSIEEFLQ